MITQERLKEVLCYNFETGVFTWKCSTARCISVGDEAGSIMQNGYVSINIDNMSYKAHRLAFLYMEGKFPTDQVDHIDRTRGNNKWSNLREATGYENQSNTKIRSDNTSGVKGVTFNKWDNNYTARCCIGGDRSFIGRFNSLEEAALAYELFAKEHRGVFYCE